MLRGACVCISSLPVAEATDLSGVWSRDARRNSGVYEALLARGLPPAKARQEANKQYVQRWRRVGDVDACDWEVITYDAKSLSLNEAGKVCAQCSSSSFGRQRVRRGVAPGMLMRSDAYARRGYLSLDC